MKTSKHHIILLTLVLSICAALTVFLYTGLKEENKKFPGARFGELAKSFKCEQIKNSQNFPFDNATFSPESEWYGQPVILSFLPQECLDCKNDLKALEHAQNTFKEERLVVIAITTKILNEINTLKAPLCLDKENAIALKYRVHKKPAAILIGPSGIIIHRFESSLADSLELLKTKLANKT